MLLPALPPAAQAMRDGWLSGQPGGADGAANGAASLFVKMDGGLDGGTPPFSGSAYVGLTQDHPSRNAQAASAAAPAPSHDSKRSKMHQ